MGRFSGLFMMAHQGNIDVYLVIGFGFGLLLFFRGLRVFRKSLMVADTPIIPVRSVAMGIAQVHGHAGGDTPFPSPVSGTPCYAFRVKIDRYDRRNGWQHYRTDQNGMRFYLSDDSGRIHVDPKQAELDVPVSGRRIVGDPPMRFSLVGLLGLSRWNNMSDDSVGGKTDDELLEYAAASYDYSNSYRFTELCIEPDQEYDVLGTCVENPRPEDDNDRNLITKGEHNGTFLISSRSAEELKSGMGWRSTMMVIGGASMAVFCAALFMARHGLL
ncbi:MAG TPA: GIDE domain-containing protein [Terriglobia bacterium]|nr:GIDE domain-containing protein [Terriglobia bacterium]